MQRKHVVFISVGLLLAGLATREVFIHQEIKSLQNEIKMQMNDRFEQASEQRRVEELAAASTVFQSYVEPVLSTSSRLLWPYSRDSIGQNWKREIFAQLDDQLFQTQQRLKAAMDGALKDTMDRFEASSARLKEIIAIRKRFSTDPQFAELIENELQLITKAAQEKDMALLEQIRVEGRVSLDKLSQRLKRFDHSKLASFISSGKFSSEIEQPVAELILQLRQEATRKNAWKEFQSSVQETLQKRKSTILSNSKKNVAAVDRKESKRIAELFDSISKSLDQEESQLSVQAPDTDIPLPTYPNPAGPDYQ
jgi:hypothetical protein